MVFNIIGFGFSVVTLAVSHDALGLTSRLADNVSANVIGLGLGTAFRFVTYKHVVFRASPVGRRRSAEDSQTLAGPTAGS